MKRSRGTSKSDKDSIQEEGPDSDAEVSFTGRCPAGLCRTLPAELRPGQSSLHPIGATLIIFSCNIMKENKCGRRKAEWRDRPGRARAASAGDSRELRNGTGKPCDRSQTEQGEFPGQRWAVAAAPACSLLKGLLEIQNAEFRITELNYEKCICSS